MSGAPHPCPCCGFRTLNERGGWEICPVCFWEDGLDYPHPDHPSGVNHGLSLNDARENFRAIGAVAAGYRSQVRPPRPSEM